MRARMEVLGGAGRGRPDSVPNFSSFILLHLVTAVTEAGPALGDGTTLPNNPTTCALSHFADEVKKLSPSHVAGKWRHRDLPWAAGPLGLALWLAWQEVPGPTPAFCPCPRGCIWSGQHGEAVCSVHKEVIGVLASPASSLEASAGQTVDYGFHLGVARTLRWGPDT